MIFDFDMPYSTSGYVVGGKLPASLFKRAERFVVHALNIPIHLIKTIIELFKFSLLYYANIFTFYQSEFIKKHTIAAHKESSKQLVSIPLSIVGLFAPMNAENWLIHAKDWIDRRG